MPPAGGKPTPPIFFPEKENGRCDRPKERRHIGREQLEKVQRLWNESACLILLRDDLVCFYLRCRSANLVAVQPDHRLTMVLINTAGSLPPDYRHSHPTE